jgi:hypothetical protein
MHNSSPLFEHSFHCGLLVPIRIWAFATVDSFEAGDGGSFRSISFVSRAGTPSDLQTVAVLQMPKKPPAPVPNGLASAKIEELA